MIEIRFHGRGGQGAVVASRILAVSAFLEGKFVQAFPTFTVERRGSPVCGFVRIDDKPIYARYQIYTPHHVVVLDPSLLKFINVLEGLQPDGTVLINSPSLPEIFKDNKKYKFAYIDATSVAIRNGLGTRATPIVNTAMLGAFVKVTNIVKLESITEAIKQTVTTKPEQNITAIQEAYNQTVIVNR